MWISLFDVGIICNFWSIYLNFIFYAHTRMTIKETFTIRSQGNWYWKYDKFWRNFENKALFLGCNLQFYFLSCKMLTICRHTCIYKFWGFSETGTEMSIKNGKTLENFDSHSWATLMKRLVFQFRAVLILRNAKKERS